MVERFRRSIELTKASIAELVGNIGISLVFGIVALVLAIAAIALVAAAVGGIFTARLYRYATKGDGGTMFRTDTLAAAFRAKGGR